jgi:hypothetical protein
MPFRTCREAVLSPGVPRAWGHTRSVSTSSPPPASVLCLALFGPVGVGFTFAPGGPAWSIWVMIGVTGLLAAIVALIRLESKGFPVPTSLQYLMVLSLFAIPTTSFYVAVWIVTGSWIVSALFGAVLGYVAFGVMGSFVRSRQAAVPATPAGSTHERFSSAPTRPSSAPEHPTSTAVGRRPRPRAKSR